MQWSIYVRPGVALNLAIVGNGVFVGLEAASVRFLLFCTSIIITLAIIIKFFAKNVEIFVRAQ